MHGARIDACGECMRVHVHGDRCMGELHAWCGMHGSPRPGAWPGAELHACLGVHACMYAGGCTRMVHAGCMGGLEVLQRCRVHGSALHMHGVRSSAYMHGVTIL
jgi:hypothetical protein